jgi:hypothetical protein
MAAATISSPKISFQPLNAPGRLVGNDTLVVGDITIHYKITNVGRMISRRHRGSWEFHRRTAMFGLPGSTSCESRMAELWSVGVRQMGSR